CWNFSRYFETNTFEVLPYVVMSGVTSESCGGTFVMNLDVWDSLPADVQQIMTEERKEQEKWVNDLEKAVGDELLEEYEAEGIIDIYILPSEERARWVAACDPFYETLVSEWGEKGKKVLEIARYYQAKYAGES
ncbi:unnamed protein product, partial [marine sediment metagenome]